jgi:hypothetical protein
MECSHTDTLQDIFDHELPYGECWEWPTVNRDGYGYYYCCRKQFLIHRKMYEFVYGPIPTGHHIDHVHPYCQHRNCCNPHHLEAVTHKVNQRRKVIPGYTEE